jgi:FkbH-like protein
MKLIEALKIVQSPLPKFPRNHRVFLACGCTPLHLHTFLAAHIRKLMLDSVPEIKTGLFGDLIGNIERVKSSETDVIVVALEWADLDPRLSIRNLGGWRLQQLSDIVVSAESSKERIRHALEAVSRDVPTILSLPTLPLPPAFTTRPLQSALQELQLNRIVGQLAETLAVYPNIRLLNPQRLAQLSSPDVRYDINSDLLSGFPYTLGHSSAMAELMAGLIENPPPMKGLITDLDDTLWAGVLGEDGVDGISWNLNNHSLMHGVYQQLLSSLAATGILIGVASKNDPDIVAGAWKRSDLLLSREDIFPFEVHWESKSGSIRRILNTWNIAADAVVFIDDSPLEVAEVQASFPEMKCKVFPQDPNAIWELLLELRNLFGKSSHSAEDSLRSRSIRDAVTWRDENGSPLAPSEEFLRSVEARIYFECGRAKDSRAFDLVNKTNQFNLNGKRFTEAEWREFLSDPSAFLLTATYEDKFGSLGKVAVLMGNIKSGVVHLRTWVMSCRAFSRRIEHQCLRYIFDEFGATQVTFEYLPTGRNGPIKDFLVSIAGTSPGNLLGLAKEDFSSMAPQMFHRVEANIHA